MNFINKFLNCTFVVKTISDFGDLKSIRVFISLIKLEKKSLEKNSIM